MGVSTDEESEHYLQRIDRGDQGLDGNATNKDEEVEEENMHEEDVDEGLSKKMKILQTLVLYFGVLDLGLSGAQIGPTLLDLEMITSSNTATISLVVVVRSIGSLVGNVAAGFVIEKVNPWFMLAINKLVAGICTILAPWCRSIPLLTLCFLPAGIMGGYYDASGNTLILLIWGKENGPWMQAFHCIFGVGCLLAPLISEPFLYKKPSQDIEHLTTSPDWVTHSYKYSADANVTGRGVTIGSSNEQVGETKVMYAYLICGLLMLLSCCCMCGMYLAGDRKLQLKKKSNEKVKENAKDGQENATRPRCLYVMFLTLLSLLFGFYVAFEVVFYTYLMTFAVKHLNWSKTNGAAVTSAFMACFTGGRALGIILVNVIRAWVLLIIDVVVCAVFAVILVGFVKMHPSVLWLCSVGLGIGMATVYATGFTLAESFIGVSGKISALILVASSIGEMSGPSMTGPLMEKVGNMSYVYMTLGLSLLCLGSLVSLELVGFKMKRVIGSKKTDSIVEIDVKPDDPCLQEL